MNINLNDIYNPRAPEAHEVNEIQDPIECLREYYLLPHDQFLIQLAQKIDRNNTDVLIPELKSLIDKIFWVLSKDSNPITTQKIEPLIRCLLEIYRKGHFFQRVKRLADGILVFYKEYLFFYLEANFHCFKGDMFRLHNSADFDRDSLVSINQEKFNFGLDIIMGDFCYLLEVILGETFNRIGKKYTNWNNLLLQMIDDWRKKLGFAIPGKIFELRPWSLKDFSKWLKTSQNYVFNKNLESSFKKFSPDHPNIDIEENLHNIYDSVKMTEKWIKKGISTRELIPLLIRLDIYSTEGFLISEKELNSFFISLIQFYTWIISRRCSDVSLVTNQQSGVSFLYSAKIKQKIMDNVTSLTDLQRNSLQLELMKYGQIVENFKNLIYDAPREVPPVYDFFSKFLVFIEDLLLGVHENGVDTSKESSSRNPASVMFYDNSISYYIPEYSAF